jgi:hypothetical protein
LASLPHRRFNQTVILPTSFLPPEMAEPNPPLKTAGPLPPKGSFQVENEPHRLFNFLLPRCKLYIFQPSTLKFSFLNSLLYPPYLLDLLTHSSLRSITPSSLIPVNHSFCATALNHPLFASLHSILSVTLQRSWVRSACASLS